MVGRAAGDRHEEGGILFAQCRARLPDRRCRLVEKAGRRFGNLIDFAPHIGLHDHVFLLWAVLTIPAGSIPRRSRRRHPGRASG